VNALYDGLATGMHWGLFVAGVILSAALVGCWLVIVLSLSVRFLRGPWRAVERRIGASAGARKANAAQARTGRSAGRTLS
jgi:hypothetical protein